jgi:hypothetical protein
MENSETVNKTVENDEKPGVMNARNIACCLLKIQAINKVTQSTRSNGRSKVYTYGIKDSNKPY